MKPETLELLIESIERQRKRVSYLEDTFLGLADAIEKDMDPKGLTDLLIASLQNQSVLDELAKVTQNMVDKQVANMDNRLAANVMAIGSLVERVEELEKEVGRIKRNSFVIYNV